jgi:hypothetical protein
MSEVQYFVQLALQLPAARAQQRGLHADVVSPEKSG